MSIFSKLFSNREASDSLSSSERERLRRDAFRTEPDYKNMFNTIDKGTALYKELATICHPDRYLDPETKAKAEKLFQELVKNKTNYSEMLRIKNAIYKELPVNR